MKIALLTVLLMSLSAFCFGVFQFTLGFDLAGNHNVDSRYRPADSDDEYTEQPERDYDVAMGISPAVEYLYEYRGLLVGLGAEYQVQRDGKFDNGNDKFGFIPLYGVVRYNFATELRVNPELVLQAGYNFFTSDDQYKEGGSLKGGLYWGVGAGLEIREKYLIQAMYKTNRGKLTADTYSGSNLYRWEGNITNTQINLSLGVRI